MQDAAPPTDSPSEALALESHLRVQMFRVALGCTLAVHGLYLLLLSQRLLRTHWTVFTLALAIGAWVELRPASVSRDDPGARHLTGMCLLGALYTVFLSILVTVTGAVPGSAVSWWLLVFPACLILAGAVRRGLALLGAALLWFVTVRLAVVLGAWTPTIAANTEPVVSVATMLASTALLGTLMALSVRQREAKQAALQRVAERLAAEREEARAEANAKDLLLVNTTHEMRTPLNSVIGLAELLTTSGLSRAQEREMLGLMRQSAALLRSLVDDVLDYAKLEAGRLTIERVEFPLRTTIFGIAHLFAPQAHAKGLEIGVSLDPDLPHRVLGDPLRLRQILANFASNAVKFTASGGVQLCARVAAPGRLRVEVHDSGPGLDEAALARLFQPFAQAGGDTARLHGGSGLGLSICRRLAEHMGGEVGARSTPGEGSVFWVELPLQSVPAGSPYDYPQLPAMGELWLVSANRFLHWTVSDMLQLRVPRVHASARLDDPRLAGLPARSVVLVDAQALQDSADAHALDELARRLRELGTVPVLLLSSITSAAPASITGEMVSLYKPLRLSQLLAALLKALDPLPQAQAAAPSPDAPARPLAGLRVLLAEDNPVNQLVARSMLENLGARVVVADNGQQALDALAGEAFDLVLLDWEMPDLDGGEVTRRWREQERREGRTPTRILAVTGHRRPDAGPRGQAAGMDGFLAKPYFSDQLLQAIRELGLAGPAPD
jgi:signal transduction histidine kinase/ActR/RegA family two-component response regulator